jgi:hypothetical protein
MRAPEAEGAAIVMVGSFNPAIFQPRWLGSLNLIRPEEAESAKITTIQPELADFTTEWFQLQVVQNRLLLQSLDPTHFGPLRDLVIGMFALLPHTPIKRFGINRMFHYGMASAESWHGVGHQLAPKDFWNTIMDEPGLLTMTIQGRRKQESNGILRVKIEPSVQISQGVYIEVNEEFKAPGDGQPEGAQWVPDCLTQNWDAMMKFAEGAAQNLLSFVER